MKIYFDLPFLNYHFLGELLLSPFLFQYNSIMIRPSLAVRAHAHLLIIILVFLLYALTGFVKGPICSVIIIVFIAITGTYFGYSVRLMIKLIRGSGLIWEYFKIPGHLRIIIFNFLIAWMLILSTFLYMSRSMSNIYLTQIPKALIIYYIYFLVSRKADFAK